MPAISARAPGKIILFGEHAVVYGRPAIAAPVEQVQARAMIQPHPTAPRGEVEIEAPAIGIHALLAQLDANHPLGLAVRLVQKQLGLDELPAFRLRVTSTIPIASGLGSGAAISIAIARAVSAFLGRSLADEQVSEIAYEVDRLYHGTPSGIDNTVITFARPVFFVRGQPFAMLSVHEPFTILVGNSGIAAPTGSVVGDLRRRWMAEPALYEPLFDQIGEVALEARTVIESGESKALGLLMTSNHLLLQKLDVSCPELDRLVDVALQHGALGAKLSGGGRGGNMIALVADSSADRVANALMEAGATNTIKTTIR